MHNQPFILGGLHQPHIARLDVPSEMRGRKHRTVLHAQILGVGDNIRAELDILIYDIHIKLFDHFDELIEPRLSSTMSNIRFS